MRAGLKLQFIIMTVTLVAITVLGSSYFFTQQEREVLLREMTRRGSTIARNLGIISTDSLISGDHLSLATYVNSTMKNEGIVYGMILTDKSKILAHNRIENVGKSYLEPPGVRPLTNEEILIQPYRNDKKEPIIDIAIPINLRNGVRIGAVHVGMSQKSIDQYVRQAFRDSLSIAAGLLIIGVIIAIIVTNFMLRPFGDLVKGAKAIGEGNLNYKIRIKGKNELSLLAQSFNEMTDRLKELYIGVLRAMAKALESRDPFAGGHDQRVAEYAAACAERIHLTPEEVGNIRLAAQVQNLGHIAVPDAILENTGKLTDEEYEKLKKHPTVGAGILDQVQALRGTVKLVLHHHERFNGTGYPNGVMGKEIPLGARILAVADAYDAMTSPQKHREAISPEAAVEELKRGAGTQFDPEIVAAFIETLDQMSRR
ncbi:HD domain-containing protein [candidate division FCPU426 bacterium]|nr:HD domain-containing protein [candidate division FCPU426 bacterium]